MWENIRRKKKEERTLVTGSLNTSNVKSLNITDTAKTTSKDTVSNNTSNVKSVNNTDTAKTTSKDTEHSESFLGLGLENPKPPPVNQASGNGSGEDMKVLLNMMSQLIQLLHPVRIQTSQVQQAQPVQVQAHHLNHLLVPQQMPQQVLLQTQ